VPRGIPYVKIENGARPVRTGKVRKSGRSVSPAQQRRLATVADAPAARGPLEEYDERVQSNRLRDDGHQRSMCPCSRRTRTGC